MGLRTIVDFLLNILAIGGQHTRGGPKPTARTTQTNGISKQGNMIATDCLELNF
jgi:hypothetical protein